MVDSVRDHTLEPLLAGLIREVMVGDPTIEQALKRVVDLATRVIQGVDGASITLYKRDLTPFSKALSHDWVLELDAVQYQSQQGPCMEVAVTSAPTAGSADLAGSLSWPVFGPAAARLRVRAVLAVGLAPHPDLTDPAQGPPGALNLYSRRPFAFGLAARDEALLLAAIAGQSIQLVAARADLNRLRDALSSRDVIGQAKGILMERHGIGEEEAFSILRGASNGLNIKLRDVAKHVTQRRDDHPVN